VIYHGTLVENLCGIAREGLVPDPSSGYLWLSRNFRVAAQWAVNRAVRWDESEMKHAPHTVLRARTRITTLADPNLPGDHASLVTTVPIAPDDLDVAVGNLWSKQQRWKPLLVWALERCQKTARQLDAEITEALTKGPRR
jgi:hypothetical protein